jgi:hypothetical protein
MATATVTLEGNTNVKVSPSLGGRILAAQMTGDHEVDCTQEELIGLLSGLDRAKYNQFIGISTDTEPRLSGGKSNPLVGLRKVSSYVGRFHVWKDAVENQLKRDGVETPEYQPATPRGKEYVGDSPVMVGNSPNTKGTHYLAVIPVRGGKPTVTYYHPSIEVSQEEAKAAEYRSPSSAKQATAGVQKELFFRTPKVENIVSLKLGGFEFRVTD